MTVLYEDELQINQAVKDVRTLLQKINPNITWVDYIPPSCFGGKEAYLVVEKKDYGVKYLDIYGCNAPQMVTKLFNALDDYNLNIQFLSRKQTEQKRSAFFSIAKDKTRKISKTIRFLQDAKEEELEEYLSFLQNMGTIPPFFPEIPILQENLKNFLISYVESKNMTFFDADILLSYHEHSLKKECSLEKERSLERKGEELSLE